METDVSPGGTAGVPSEYWGRWDLEDWGFTWRVVRDWRLEVLTKVTRRSTGSDVMTTDEVCETGFKTPYTVYSDLV